MCKIGKSIKNSYFNIILLFILTLCAIGMVCEIKTYYH